MDAFYNYIKLRKLDEAFNLLSKERIGDLAFDDWVKGYDNTLDVSLIDIYEAEESEDEVYIKLESKDLVGQNVEYQYFEGNWRVNRENGQYLLSQSHIEKIENPSWDWFLPKEYEENY